MAKGAVIRFAIELACRGALCSRWPRQSVTAMRSASPSPLTQPLPRVAASAQHAGPDRVVAVDASPDTSEAWTATHASTVRGARARCCVNHVGASPAVLRRRLPPVVPGAEALEVRGLVAPAVDLRHDVVDVGGGTTAGRASVLASTGTPDGAAAAAPDACCQSAPYPRCVVVPPPQATQRPGRDVTRRQPGQGCAVTARPARRARGGRGPCPARTPRRG